MTRSSTDKLRYLLEKGIVMPGVGNIYISAEIY